MKSIQFLAVFSLTVCLLVVCSGLSAQASWILEETDGTVLLERSGAANPAPVTAPPRVGLNAGESLILQPGARIRVFDGREVSTRAHPSDSASATTVRIPPPPERGTVMGRVFARMTTRRQSVQGGVIVRPGIAKASAELSWPAQDGSFAGKALPAIHIKSHDMLGQTARIEVWAVESIGDLGGVLVGKSEVSIVADEIQWRPEAKLFKKGTFFVIRLYVGDEEWDRRTVWNEKKGFKALEKKLAEELGHATTKRLKADPAWSYFKADMDASRLGVPPVAP